MAANEQTVLEQVGNLGRTPGELTPDDFEQSATTTGEESRALRRRADALFALRHGEDHPLKVAVPAYESFTTDATAGNVETFTLSNSVTKCPDTEDIVVWLDGTYYGVPDAVDYGADTFDVTDSGTASTVHAYFVSDESATLRMYRAWPGGDTRDRVYLANLGLVHKTNQSEDPEVLDLSIQALEEFVATDMTLDVTVRAPYTVQFSEDTDGTFATNALFQVETLEGHGTVPGLAAVLQERRARR